MFLATRAPCPLLTGTLLDTKKASTSVFLSQKLCSRDKVFLKQTTFWRVNLKETLGFEETFAGRAALEPSKFLT